LNSLRHKAHLAQELSLPDWLTLIEAWLVLSFFRLALRWISYQRLTAPTQLIQDRAADPSHVWESAQRIQRMIRYASRLHFPAMSCLPQSLALRSMLTRRGIPACIHIGVQKNSNDLYAHAWVEVLGKIVGETDAIIEKFNVLASPLG